MRRIWVYRCGEKTEDDDDSPIANRECIECNTPYTGDVEGAPNKLVSLPGMATHLAGFSDIAADAAPEEEELGDGVGTVERRDTDR